MKKILLALLLPFAAAAQTSVQKVGSGNNTVSNGAIVIGSNNSLTATGTGIIAATTVPNITINTTAPLVGGGLLTGNLTLSMPFATSLVDGYLKAADWTTFNAKQPAGNYITALTGDGTAAGPGSSAFTLATVNTNVGTFASSTVNGKGLVTAAGNLTGDITTSGAAATLATVNSNVGTFAGITINGKGLATAASNLTITTTAPITGGGILGNLTFAMPASSATVNGYLTSTDWSTFNGKESVLTFNAPLSRTANAISIPVSTNSVDGYLSGVDHTTFAAKQPAGNYLTTLTGDGTAAGPGSSALTLATVNADVGTFAGITLNGKGLATGASSLTITTTAPLTGGGTLGNLTIAEPASTNSVDGYLTAADHTTFAAKQPAGNYITALTGDGTATGPGSAALTLATVATGATTGSSTAIPVVTFNNKGLVTGVTTAAVVAPAGTLTGTTLATNVVSSSLTGLGNITTGTWSADVIGVAKGGTNLSSYTTGDLVYATGATTIGKLSDVALGSVLTSGGVGGLPSYAALGGLAVTSLAGTTNQIAASAATGGVTLSIPTNPILPGNVTSTGTTTATQLIAAGNPQLTAVTTIAALEALTVTALTTNTSVNVLGYYAAGDGGGGLFTFTTSSSATVNHGTVCSTPSGGTTRWLRNYVGPMNVRWFGAKGDGVTADTTAIVAAKTAAGSGGSLYFQAGVYITSSQITFDSISLFGDSAAQSKIKANASVVLSNIDLFLMTGSNISIHGLTFDFGAASISAGYCSVVGFFQTTKVVMADCVVTGFDIGGVGGGGCSDIVIQRNVITCNSPPSGAVQRECILFTSASGLSTNVRILENTLTNAAMLLSIDKCMVLGNQISTFKYGAGITVNTDSDNFTISGNQIRGGTGTDVNLTDCGGIESYAPNTIITSNSCSLNSGNGIFVAGKFNVVSNNACWNNGQTTGHGNSGISAFVNSGSHPDNLVLTGNSCYDSQGSPTQTWGIFIGTGVQSTYLANNSLWSNTSGPISNSGTRASSNNPVLEGSKSWNPGTVAPLSSTFTTVTISGAVLGDIATGSLNGDLSNGFISASVAAANSIQVILTNPTGGPITPGALTLRVRVAKPNDYVDY